MGHGFQRPANPVRFSASEYGRRDCGRWSKNRIENSIFPFLRPEGAMALFREMRMQVFEKILSCLIVRPSIYGPPEGAGEC